MKTTIKTFIICAILGVFAIAGCKKYEEGPSISLLSKKSRLAGDWSLDKYFEDGVDKTSTFGGTTINYKIEKDGSYTLIMTIPGFPSSTETGKWEFINKKEDLKTSPSTTGATPDTMEIIKLKSKELWLREKSGSPKSEYHLKQ